MITFVASYLCLGLSLLGTLMWCGVPYPAFTLSESVMVVLVWPVFAVVWAWVEIEEFFKRRRRKKSNL